MSTPIEKYIRIEPTLAKAKTQVWHVINQRSSEIVGVIKWYGGWRKYVFYPAADCFFDWACLAFIGAWCETSTSQQLRNKGRATWSKGNV